MELVLIKIVVQLEQEKLKRDQQCTGYANLGNMVQHTCHKVCL